MLLTETSSTGILPFLAVPLGRTSLALMLQGITSSRNRTEPRAVCLVLSTLVSLSCIAGSKAVRWLGLFLHKTLRFRV